MKSIGLLFLLLSLTASTLAQKANLVWAKQCGGSDDEYASVIVADANGNIYTTGSFFSNSDLYPGASVQNLSSVGGQDLFIQKLDAEGNLLWVKQIGGSSQDVSTCLALDHLGNVYVGGNFGATVDFDPGPGTSTLTAFGGFDGFILKLDGDGNFIWVKQFGSEEYDSPISLAIDAQGNVYHTGYFYNTSDFDPGEGTYNLTAFGQEDTYVQKLDAEGHLLWVNQLGGKDFDMGYSLALDNSNNVYVLGQFAGTSDFDPGVGVNELVSDNGSYDIFLQKFDAEGNSIWVKQIGGAYMDIGQALTLGSTGELHITGKFYGNVDFDPGSGVRELSSPTGIGAAFVLKLDAEANYIWAKQTEGTGSANALSIKVDPSDEVYIIGEFDNTVDFNPGAEVFNVISNGSNDGFLLKLDVNGDFVWAKQTGGTNYDAGMSLALDPDGSIYTMGQFRNTVDFNPNAGVFSLTSTGQYDISIRKLSQCKMVTDVSTLISGNTITANTSGASYQWLACDQNYAILPGETAQSFTASANGQYAVEISQNGCVDTSASSALVITSIHDPLTGPLNSHISSNKIILETGGRNITELMILDMQGRIIYSIENLSQSLVELEVTPGVYVGQIIVDNQVEVIKFLVE